MGLSSLVNATGIRGNPAQVVAQFTAAGAILIAKTNVPQTMSSFGCCNPLVGYFASGTGAAGIVGAFLWWKVRRLGVHIGVGLSSNHINQLWFVFVGPNFVVLSFGHVRPAETLPSA
ncbi:hypothetical protein B0H10DRAFT_1947371 [Mycena sp. CBHHK59/15]|nr:hypothetical protein B0H10DRAFT_1947371 [Mycena sp. CBHHK59/15]